MSAARYFCCPLAALFLAFTAFAASAQDTLVTVKGEILPVKLVEINHQIIWYRAALPDTASALTSVDLKEVFIIKYQNGTRQVFAENLAATGKNETYGREYLQRLGKTDARRYYDAKNYSVLTGGITLLSPPVGMVMVLMAGTPPPPALSAISDKNLIGERPYIEAYQKEARKIKKGKALKGFAFGLGAYILIIGSIASNS